MKYEIERRSHTEFFDYSGAALILNTKVKSDAPRPRLTQNIDNKIIIEAETKE